MHGYLTWPLEPTEGSVRRAERILAQVLPEIRSHDHAMEHLFYIDPNNDGTRLWSIAAAMFILNEARAVAQHGAVSPGEGILTLDDVRRVVRDALLQGRA